MVVAATITGAPEPATFYYELGSRGWKRIRKVTRATRQMKQSSPAGIQSRMGEAVAERVSVRQRRDTEFNSMWRAEPSCMGTRRTIREYIGRCRADRKTKNAGYGGTVSSPASLRVSRKRRYFQSYNPTHPDYPSADSRTKVTGGIRTKDTRRIAKRELELSGRGDSTITIKDRLKRRKEMLQ